MVDLNSLSKTPNLQMFQICNWPKVPSKKYLKNSGITEKILNGGARTLQKTIRRSVRHMFELQNIFLECWNAILEQIGNGKIKTYSNIFVLCKILPCQNPARFWYLPTIRRLLIIWVHSMAMNFQSFTDSKSW